MVHTYMKCVLVGDYVDVGRFDRSYDRHKCKIALVSVGHRPTHFYKCSKMIGLLNFNRPTEKCVGRHTSDIILKNYAHHGRPVYIPYEGLIKQDSLPTWAARLTFRGWHGKMVNDG
jgi:hypothetical protein